jgi:integrase
MAIAKLQLDSRTPNKDGFFPVVIYISHNRKYVQIPLKVYIPSDLWVKNKWGNCEVSKKFPDAERINRENDRILEEVKGKIQELEREGKDQSMTAKDIKDYVLSADKKPVVDEKSFWEYSKRFLAGKTGRTAEIYADTFKRMKGYNSGSLALEDITVSWLKDFENYLIGLENSVNTRAIHFRNIRAVINSAIDDEIILRNPFRKFKIAKKVDSDTFPLTVDQLRMVRDMDIEQDAVSVARDVFMISFYLVGINISDIYNLKNGERCRYMRSKTHKMYDISLEPEIIPYIKKYSDEDRMFSFFRRWTDTRSFRSAVNSYLKAIGKEIGEPHLKLYHARHTYATIAYSAGISRDDIGEMLGHSRKTVTDVYARYDRKRIDVNHRKVLDLLK